MTGWTLRAFFIILLHYASVNAEVVTCNHNTTICECVESTDEVCEFTLDIEMLQTFTRYLLDDSSDSRGTAGSVWLINDEGEWKAVDPKDTLCGTSITDTRCTQPFGVDGYTFRSFIGVNGRIPGPTLIVTEGQLVKVNVINRLASESISIHWHGMHQRNSNWMDGVEHVTQCGIPPGASFTYIFNESQYGTHWYHSHSGAQRTDGLFGALIVKEKESDATKVRDEIGDLVDIPSQHTLTLLDWQVSNAIDLFTRIHSSIRYYNIENAANLRSNPASRRTYSSDGAEVGPVPYWSGIINGKGRHGSVPYVNSELSVFEVSPGSVYRFRLIGAQSLYAYRFSIDRHTLRVIATDGQFVVPIEVDFIIIHSGERYDFLLQTKNNTSQNDYLIRAVTLEVNNDQENVAEAVLHYDTGPYPKPTDYQSIAQSFQSDAVRCTESSSCTALNCPFLVYPQSYHINCEHIHNLRLLFPVSDTDLPTNNAKGSTSLFFNFGFEGISQTSAINARNLRLPSSPPALYDTPENLYEETCKNLDTDWECDKIDIVPDSNCYCAHVVNVSSDHTIQLVISATGPNTTLLDNFLFAHPVHLHGHYFQVADVQFGLTNNITGRLEEGSSDINCGGDLLCTNPSWNTKIYDNFDLDPAAPLKDTLLIPAGGYAVVYFKSNNTGWWFLHCHIEVHQLEGMGVIINEGGKKTRPPKGMKKCGDFSLTVEEYEKAVRGITDENSGTPFTWKYFGLFIIFLVLFVIAVVIIVVIAIGCYCKRKKHDHYQVL